MTAFYMCIVKTASEQILSLSHQVAGSTDNLMAEYATFYARTVYLCSRPQKQIPSWYYQQHRCTFTIKSVNVYLQCECLPAFGPLFTLLSLFQSSGPTFLSRNDCEYVFMWNTDAACAIDDTQSTVKETEKESCMLQDPNSNYTLNLQPLKRKQNHPYHVKANAYQDFTVSIKKIRCQIKVARGSKN